MTEDLIWIRGNIVPKSEATVSVLSPMAQFGINVFEGIRCYWNPIKRELYAFRLRDHLIRLLESCRILQIRCPYSVEQIEGYIRDVINANSFSNDTAIRLTLFVDEEGTWHSSESVEMFIAPTKRKRTDLEALVGSSATVSSWQRIGDNTLPPRAKVGANYVNGRYGYLQARRDGYDYPIFLGSDGKVAESAGSCIFIERNDKLVTPPATASSLESITSRTLIAIAMERGIPVEQRPLDRTELYLASEAFLCGTAAEVIPLVTIDRIKIADGRPGKVTRTLLEQYLAIASGETEAHSEWRTMI